VVRTEGVAEGRPGLADAGSTDLSGPLVEAPVGLVFEEDQLTFHVPEYE
jgi:hypothetical protein